MDAISVVILDVPISIDERILSLAIALLEISSNNYHVITG
jgi:hypothetical protein